MLPQDHPRDSLQRMTSVRLRLLILALLPLIVLMPALLWLGMTRWTADYDRVLIANVESDLRIAEQYLEQLKTRTGADLAAIAQSRQFARQDATRDAFLASEARAKGLDFLYFLPGERIELSQRWPVILAAQNGETASALDIFSQAHLRGLQGAATEALVARAVLELVPTEAARPTDRAIEDRGMVIHAAAPVPGGGVLVGGILLNRNLQFIDTINELVYASAVTGGTRAGTATLFLEDVRISTNVRLFDDERALGTRVSEAVRAAVLDNGQTWLDRAFVVDDWYISGYLPLLDSFGGRIGMLYVGFLEAPFAAAKKAAIWWMFAAFIAVLVLSVPVFLWLAKGIFAPLERMIDTMRSVTRGNYAARNGITGRRDEIGEVAGHLDRLLDEIEYRDAQLRASARELEVRVEERTRALREANEKLEDTYQQLVTSEKLASIGEITAGVAHEINNPVAVIQGNVDVMRQVLGADAECVATELHLIDRQITRIEAIVGKLLTFARPDHASDAGQPIALQPVIEDCLVLVDHVLSRAGVTIETYFAPCPEVRIPSGEMQQVVINLVTNAAQAMDPGGRLVLRLVPFKEDGRAGALLSVEDTGPGLSDIVLGRLFDPFFTTKLSEGTGLGLSISRTLISRAGGRITAENAATGGARFSVWLPGAEDESVQAAE